MNVFREIFGLIVRLVGLSFLLYAALCAVWAGLEAIGIQPENEEGEAFSFALWAAIAGLAGFCLLRGAPVLMAWTYPDARNRNGDETA